MVFVVVVAVSVQVKSKQHKRKKESKEGRSGILDRKKEKKMEVVEGLN